MDKYISKAGLEKLKPLLPKEINLENNPDFIAIVLNAAVAGRSNANGDAVTNETAISISKNFINKYCNINHSKDDIKGVIVNYGFSKFGTNELLTEEEAKASKDPFNISLAVLLWKRTLNDEFIGLLEASVDPTNSSHQKISASWELSFNSFDIAVGTKNINESEIITSEEHKKEFENCLLCEGGKGSKDGKLVYRVISGEILVPMGIGLVSNPAADVKGLEIVSKEENKNVKAEDDSKSDITISVAFDIEKSVAEFKKTVEAAYIQILDTNAIVSKLTQNFTDNKNSVIVSNKTNINKNIMDKVNKISDITDESIKECKASVIVDFISEEIKKANAQWKEQEEKTKNAEAEKAKVEASLVKMQEDLKKLQDIQAAKEAEEVFTQRMTYFDDTYELSQEERQVIASEIKDADKDAFEKAKSKFDVLLKNKSKAAIKEQQDLEEAEAKKSGKVFDIKTKKWVNKEDVKEEKKESKASTDDEKIIDDALKNGTQANAGLPNAKAEEQTLEQKYAEFFKPENCIKISKR